MTPDWGGRGLAVDGFNALPRSPGEWLRACHPSLALRPTFSFSTSLRHSPGTPGAGGIAARGGCLNLRVEVCRRTLLPGDIRSAYGKRET